MVGRNQITIEKAYLILKKVNSNNNMSEYLDLHCQHIKNAKEIVKDKV